MLLKSFRVRNFRSVVDSGWIDVGSLTALVGANESGKTVLLNALCRFNPLYDEQLTLSRDWPRHLRYAADKDAVPIECRFELDTEVQNRLTGFPSTPCEALIGRKYSGEYECQVITASTKSYSSTPDFRNELLAILRPEADVTEGFGDALEDLAAHAEKTIGDDAGPQERVELIDTLVEGIEKLREHTKYGREYDTFNDLRTACVALREQQQVLTENSAVTPSSDPTEVLVGHLPKFAYIGKQSLFDGIVRLGAIKQNRDTNFLTGDDRQCLGLLALAGLDLDTEFAKTGVADKEQRVFDLQDASKRLTAALSDHWSGGKKKIMLEIDGDQIIVFMSEDSDAGLVRMDEQSFGVRWFSALDIAISYLGQDEPDCLILIDEPDSHLGPTAVSDLLHMLKRASAKQQVVCTTTSGVMFSMGDQIFAADTTAGTAPQTSTLFDTVYFCKRSDLQSGTKTHPVSAGEVDSLLSAVPKQTPTIKTPVGICRLAVAGQSAYWTVGYMAMQMRLHQRHPLSADLIVVPSALAGVADGRVLKLSADTGSKNGLTYATVLGSDAPRTVEDLLPREAVLRAINNAYAEQLGYARIGMNEVNSVADQKGIVPAVCEVFGAKLAGLGADIVTDDAVGLIVTRTVTNADFNGLDSTVIDNFAKLFDMAQERLKIT